MDKWNNEWILENAEDVFDQDFIDTVYNIFHKEYGLDKEDAEDLTIKVTWDKIYPAIERKEFDGSSEKEFWGYIRTILRNAKNDYWKEHNLLPVPIPEIFPDAEDDLLYMDVYRTPVDKYVINKEAFNEAIDKLSGNLTPEQWEVLKYTAIEMKSPEIAKIVNKSEDAVRKLRQRGRESGRKLFDGKPFEGFEL